jgi:hypothetical protein
MSIPLTRVEKRTVPSLIGPESLSRLRPRGLPVTVSTPISRIFVANRTCFRNVLGRFSEG